MIEQMRKQGVSLGFGHRRSEAVEVSNARASLGQPDATPAEIRERIRALIPSYNPPVLRTDELLEFRFATGPVFDAFGHIAFSLTLWGPQGLLSAADVSTWATRLKRVCAEATSIVGGKAPQS
jgi:hypothetical protein